MECTFSVIRDRFLDNGHFLRFLLGIALKCNLREQNNLSVILYSTNVHFAVEQEQN